MEFIIHATEETFEEEVVVRSLEVPVVVDFWAGWCAPCRVLGATLEKLALEFDGSFVLAKVDVEQSPQLAMDFHVQGIPAVKIFRGGDVVEAFVGVRPENEIRQMIRKFAPTAADLALEEAQTLLAIRRWDQAEVAFRVALAHQPNNAPAALGLVRTLLAQGAGAEALQQIASFPPGSEIVVAQQLKPLAQLLTRLQNATDSEFSDPKDAQYLHAARLLAQGKYAAGMDGLLDLLRQDKKYRRGEPRLVLVAIFSLLGEEDSLTTTYRKELASVLF